MNDSPRGVAVRAANAFARIEEGLLALLLLAMILLAFGQIVLRNGFDGGLSWGDDAVRMLVFWVALFGSTVAAARGAHIRVDALVRYLPPKLARLLARAVDLVTAGLCAGLCWYGVEFTRIEHADGLVAFGSVPSWVAVAPLPVAFALMALRYALQALVGRPTAADDRVAASLLR